MSENFEESHLWQKDPALNEVLERIQGFESWIEQDAENLQSMDGAITKVMNVIEINQHLILKSGESENLSEMVESMLLILGFMPAKKALEYLMEFQKYEHFFEYLADELNKAPPLKGYAKTLLARAHVLQQRQIQLAVTSESNFSLLQRCLERVFENA